MQVWAMYEFVDDGAGDPHGIYEDPRDALADLAQELGWDPARVLGAAQGQDGTIDIDVADGFWRIAPFELVRSRSGQGRPAIEGGAR